MTKSHFTRFNSGFTLVELMISLVLGLLVVAAAIQLFMTAQISANLQRAISDIQDNGNFVINYMIEDIRKANFSADKPVIKSGVPYAGIVLGVDSLPATLTNRSVSLLTKKEAEGVDKKTNISSDQLTIQYYVDIAGQFDCEGTEIPINSYVLQRYFILDGNLRCDAGTYPKTIPTGNDEEGNPKTYTIKGFGGDGEIVIRHAEYMRILFAVSDDKVSTDNVANDPIPADGLVQKNFRYIDSYPTSGTLPRIRGVQIGLLIRSNESVGGNPDIKTRNSSAFSVLDKNNIKVNTVDSNLRQVISQTVAFRNALGSGS